MDKFNLNRFMIAQEESYSLALEEIKSGRKTSHWMWYIFPQIHGLGISSTSIKYSIKSEEEAINYLKHPILGNRLHEITTLLLGLENKSAHEIFGSPDDKKLRSSMTLFNVIQTDYKIFEAVLEKYFDNKPCFKTIDFLRHGKC